MRVRKNVYEGLTKNTSNVTVIQCRAAHTKTPLARKTITRIHSPNAVTVPRSNKLIHLFLDDGKKNNDQETSVQSRSMNEVAIFSHLLKQCFVVLQTVPPESAPERLNTLVSRRWNNVNTACATVPVMVVPP